MSSVLFEPGHPESTLDIGIEEDARAAQSLVVRGILSRIQLDLTCQPQMFSAEPGRDGSMPEIRPATAGLERMIGAEESLEDMKDREKWQLLTRELA